jgi:endonuclease/exonuclease/phosphatase family metal-dependent hydrolase
MPVLPRLTVLACIAIAAASSLFASNAARAATPLRVMSFNVRTPADTGPGRRWEDRRDAMVALLKQQRPDVVGTQELVKAQADYLVAHLDGYRWFGQGRRGGDGDEHMGVFYDSRVLTVVESGDFWLSDTPEVPGSISWGHPYPRMVTWALFERRDDHRRFYLLDTHLPYQTQDEPARVRGALTILSSLRTLPADIPVVLTGDFNTEPGGKTWQTLTRELTDTRAAAAAPTGPVKTFHDFTGVATLQLDWILVRGLQVQRFATLDDRPGGILPSDHFPVLAELGWPQ